MMNYSTEDRTQQSDDAMDGRDNNESLYPGDASEIDHGIDTDNDDAAYDAAGDAEAASGGEGREGRKDSPDTRGEYMPRMLGEIVQRRNPVLIVLVLLVGLFLAGAPLLFRYQKNSMTEALMIYDAACKHRSQGTLNIVWMKSVSGPAVKQMDDVAMKAFFESIPCVARKGHGTALRPVKGLEDGPNRAFVLSIFEGTDIQEAEKAKTPVINLFFPVRNEKLLIDKWPE